jgi:hypothetical protein
MLGPHKKHLFMLDGEQVSVERVASIRVGARVGLLVVSEPCRDAIRTALAYR